MVAVITICPPPILGAPIEYNIVPVLLTVTPVGISELKTEAVPSPAAPV